jgi:acetyl-CoA synthetase
MVTTPDPYDDHIGALRPTAYVKGAEGYSELYRRSLEEMDTFWSETAREYLSWEREWDFVLHHDVEEAGILWFGGGRLNAAYNCVDRYAEKCGDRIAYYWEGDEPGESGSVTYAELRMKVIRLAAFLKSAGINKGDRVVIYMPCIPESAVAMLACARIGAVHCVVSSGFSGEAAAERAKDCAARAVITADGFRRAGRIIPLKPKMDEPLKRCPNVRTLVVFKRCGLEIEMDPIKDVWWVEAVEDSSLPEEVPPESMDAEDPLFVVFESAAVGKPRPLVYTHGGFLLWSAMTTRLIFDLSEGETFWCTTDMGTLQGFAFSVYGALLNGLTAVLHEGAPNYPDYDRYWQIIAKYGVEKFCTDGTAIRTLVHGGGSKPDRHELSSLKILGLSEDPILPDDRRWYYHNVGGGRCPVMNMWWQTESGGPMMTALPGVEPPKPGSVSRPFPGVAPLLLDLDTGEETRFPNQEGAFFIRRPWPAMARTILGDHETYKDTYFAPFAGLFITGEGAMRDEDGMYLMTGRIDDVITTAGHRVGAWEAETALISHPMVAEAVVAGVPHRIKGQGLYAFVTLEAGASRSEQLKEELAELLKMRIGDLAVPETIQWASALPKTRGGKILRRLLQKIAEGNVDDLGDVSVVANPEVLAGLIGDRMGPA